MRIAGAEALDPVRSLDVHLTRGHPFLRLAVLWCVRTRACACVHVRARASACTAHRPQRGLERGLGVLGAGLRVDTVRGGSIAQTDAPRFARGLRGSPEFCPSCGRHAALRGAASVRARRCYPLIVVVAQARIFLANCVGGKEGWFRRGRHPVEHFFPNSLRGMPLRQTGWFGPAVMECYATGGGYAVKVSGTIIHNGCKPISTWL